QLDLTLMFNTSSGHQRIAEAIQQMWKDALGVNVKTVNQEWAVYLETIKGKDTPQIWRLGWCVDYPDANNFIREVWVYGGSNNIEGGGGISWGPGDIGYDEFEDIVLAAATETDPAKRIEMYADAEEIFVDTAAAIIPLYWYTNLTLTKPYVERTFPVTGHNDYTPWDIVQ
ncbi:MAG: ABC transporter substrate-binding protein, partial [Betaproteobacteria bacterium]